MVRALSVSLVETGVSYANAAPNKRRGHRRRARARRIQFREAILHRRGEERVDGDNGFPVDRGNTRDSLPSGCLINRRGHWRYGGHEQPPGEDAAPSTGRCSEQGDPVGGGFDGDDRRVYRSIIETPFYVVPQRISRGIRRDVRASFPDSRQPFTTMGAPPRSVAPRHRDRGAAKLSSPCESGRRSRRRACSRYRSRCRPATHVGQPSRSPHALSHGHHRGEFAALSLCPLKIRMSTVRHVRGNTC